MALIKSQLFKFSKDSEQIEQLLNQAELAINTWQNLWTPFLSAPLKEKILTLLKTINDLECFSTGGFLGAERHRICFARKHNENIFKPELAPLLGLSIEGNFLFDKAKYNDFRL